MADSVVEHMTQPDYLPSPLSLNSLELTSDPPATSTGSFTRVEGKEHVEYFRHNSLCVIALHVDALVSKLRLISRYLFVEKSMRCAATMLYHPYFLV